MGLTIISTVAHRAHDMDDNEVDVPRFEPITLDELSLLKVAFDELIADILKAKRRRCTDVTHGPVGRRPDQEWHRTNLT